MCLLMLHESELLFMVFILVSGLTSDLNRCNYPRVQLWDTDNFYTIHIMVLKNGCSRVLNRMSHVLHGNHKIHSISQHNKKKRKKRCD